jgi:hypothetical protein
MNAETTSKTQTGLQGRKILPPAHFPVVWAHSANEAHHWTRDREHNPQPITPMFATFAACTAGPGRARTVEVYKEAILGRRDLQVNTYNYTRLEAFIGSLEELTGAKSKTGNCRRCQHQVG